MFQILFHNNRILQSNKISEFIEQVSSERDKRPFGCDIKGSPFGRLMDCSAHNFRLQPGLCVSDIAAGYIYLKPIAEQKRCEWLDGYISEDMYLKYKYYYERKTETSLDSPKDVDKVFGSYKGW